MLWNRSCQHFLVWSRAKLYKPVLVTEVGLANPNPGVADTAVDEAPRIPRVGAEVVGAARPTAVPACAGVPPKVKPVVALVAGVPSLNPSKTNIIKITIYEHDYLDILKGKCNTFLRACIM